MLNVVVKHNSGTFKEVRLGNRCLRRQQMKQQEATGLGTFHPPPLASVCWLDNVWKYVQSALWNYLTLTVNR